MTEIVHLGICKHLSHALNMAFIKKSSILHACIFSHKNVLVRKSASALMASLVEKLGPGKVLTGQKDLTDKILTSASQFIQDSAPETRLVMLRYIKVYNRAQGIF